MMRRAAALIPPPFEMNQLPNPLPSFEQKH
jgi:hypothetical protein